MSPNADVVSRRLDCLVDLAQPPDAGKGRRIVLTTVNAITQRVPARAQFARAMFRAEAGAKLRLDALLAFLVRDGYRKAETVREPGEYALRGGIVDLFPPETAAVATWDEAAAVSVSPCSRNRWASRSREPAE